MTGVVKVPLEIVWRARSLCNKLIIGTEGRKRQVLRLSGSRMFQAERIAKVKAWMLDENEEIPGGQWGESEPMSKGTKMGS